MDGKKEQTFIFAQAGEPLKNPRAIFVRRSNTYFFDAVQAWLGKMQLHGIQPAPAR